MLASIKSRHILRMYRSAEEEVNQGREVRRLFLEYCPGGNLSKLLERDARATITPINPFAEVDIWEVFNCLTLGVAVIHRGTKDPNATAWVRITEIAHYDINPKNDTFGSATIYKFYLT
jgi:serine/threonine protein kinase